MNSIVTYLVILSFVNLSILLGHVTGSNVLRIRGTSINKNVLYTPDRDFECLDGSLLIPFSYVNDDYCDCADGSDEPGTPACRNVSFYCENTGHVSRYIPSTWVNDGVCDCCDASDEYRSGKECPNNCQELGQQAWLEQRKVEVLTREGNKIRKELIAKGKQLMAEYEERLAKLRTDHKEAEILKKGKELLKNTAEERESAALEKYKPVEPEQSTHEGEEEDDTQESDPEEYFKLLDSDDNGVLTPVEVQATVTFDKDKDGVVSEEEALFFLNNHKEVNLQEFVESVWPNIKPFLMLEQGVFKSAGRKDEEEETREPLEEGEGEHGKEEEDVGEGEDTTDDEPEKPEESQVRYDEETQALIDEANAAREKFQAIERSVNELQSEIRRLEEKINRDYGEEHEFAALDGECFEYADLEYIYSLCMLANATQKSKSGGSDVILGHWNDWSGPAAYKYSQMKYDRGLTCWNGPTRSTTVHLICGKENKLISVTEPNRCEYAMRFSTPALCLQSADSHDEL